MNGCVPQAYSRGGYRGGRAGLLDFWSLRPEDPTRLDNYRFLVDLGPRNSSRHARGSRRPPA